MNRALLFGLCYFLLEQPRRTQATNHSPGCAWTARRNAMRCHCMQCKSLPVLQTHLTGGSTPINTSAYSWAAFVQTCVFTAVLPWGELARRSYQTRCAARAPLSSWILPSAPGTAVHSHTFCLWAARVAEHRAAHRCHNRVMIQAGSTHLSSQVLLQVAVLLIVMILLSLYVMHTTYSWISELPTEDEIIIFTLIRIASCSSARISDTNRTAVLSLLLSLHTCLWFSLRFCRKYNL